MAPMNLISRSLRPVGRWARLIIPGAFLPRIKGTTLLAEDRSTIILRMMMLEGKHQSWL